MLALLINAITSRLAGPLALAGCALLAVLLIGAKLDAGHWRKVAGGYERSINDPATGYVAKLAQCRTNGEALKGSLGRQTASVAAFKAEADAKAAESAKALTAARRASALASRQAGAILAARAGADQCRSADDLIIESLR